MQITNSVVSDTSKCRIYKQIRPPLVDEHTFPLTGLFVSRLMLHLVTGWDDVNCQTEVVLPM